MLLHPEVWAELEDLLSKFPGGAEAADTGTGLVRMVVFVPCGPSMWERAGLWRNTIHANESLSCSWTSPGSFVTGICFNQRKVGCTSQVHLVLLTTVTGETEYAIDP